MLLSSPLLPTDMKVTVPRIPRSGPSSSPTIDDLATVPRPRYIGADRGGRCGPWPAAIVAGESGHAKTTSTPMDLLCAQTLSVVTVGGDLRDHHWSFRNIQ